LQESVSDVRKDLSALAEIITDEMKTYNTTRKRLIWKYNAKKKENLAEVIEEIKQRRIYCLATGENKTNTIKIKCVERFARNSSVFLDSQTLM
jgi:hypothetical protein